MFAFGGTANFSFIVLYKNINNFLAALVHTVLVYKVVGMYSSKNDLKREEGRERSG